MWRVQVMWLRAWEMDGMLGGTGQNQPRVGTVGSTARKKGELEGGGMAHNLAMQPHSSSRHRQRGEGGGGESREAAAERAKWGTGPYIGTQLVSRLKMGEEQWQCVYGQSAMPVASAQPCASPTIAGMRVDWGVGAFLT